MFFNMALFSSYSGLISAILLYTAYTINSGYLLNIITQPLKALVDADPRHTDGLAHLPLSTFDTVQTHRVGHLRRRCRVLQILLIREYKKWYTL